MQKFYKLIPVIFTNITHYRFYAIYTTAIVLLFHGTLCMNHNTSVSGTLVYFFHNIIKEDVLFIFTSFKKIFPLLLPLVLSGI